MLSKEKHKGEEETLYQIYDSGNSGDTDGGLYDPDRHAEQRMELYRKL